MFDQDFFDERRFSDMVSKVSSYTKYPPVVTITLHDGSAYDVRAIKENGDKLLTLAVYGEAGAVNILIVPYSYILKVEMSCKKNAKGTFGFDVEKEGSCWTDEKASQSRFSSE